MDYITFIKKTNEPIVIAPNEFPDFLAWLPGSETVKIFEKTKKTALKYWRQPILFLRWISMLCTV
jgi:hypothetical protein